MVDPAQIRTSVNEGITDNGQIVRLRHWRLTFSGADYDEGYITASGTDWYVIGLPQPNMASTAGQDRKLYEQGRIRVDDRKIFFTGSVLFESGTNLTHTIGLGSPVYQEFKVVPEGIIPWSVSGVNIYTCVYVRELNTGSFVGQY